MRDDPHRPCLQNGDMGKERDVNHLQAWRESFEMTQAELAELIGTTASVISLIETGERTLSPKWLRKIAPHFGITPGWLLDYAPGDIPQDVMDLWRSVAPEDRPQALRILETFRKRA